MRHQVVGLKDLRRQFDAWLKSFASKKEKKAEAGKLQIFRDGKPEPVPEAESLDRPAYDTMQQALADPIFKKADQIDLVPENSALAVRYVVDGFTYSGTPIDRQLGADAISYIKYAAKLNIDERRKPQAGSIRTNFDGASTSPKCKRPAQPPANMPAS